MNSPSTTWKAFGNYYYAVPGDGILFAMISCLPCHDLYQRDTSSEGEPQQLFPLEFFFVLSKEHNNRMCELRLTTTKQNSEISILVQGP